MARAAESHGELVVREAVPADLEARADLVRRSITEHDFDAFVMFFFQELTLQACVLCGAVLFIFFGAGLAACALVVPGAGAALALGVGAAHRAAAARARDRLRRELYGFVAAPAAGARLAATVSVEEARGERRGGWVRALAVEPAWRRRGVARALERACRERAAAERLSALHAATSALQSAATALLHAQGWEVRGSYHRRVVGAALTLPMTQLAVRL